MSWTYYAFWLVVPTVVALVSAHPSVLGVVAVAFVAKRWIPDPVQFMRTAGRARSLQTQLALNPSNGTASAQLAEIRLAGWRPGRATPLLEQALTRDPKSAELHYLLGLARLRGGQPAPALEALTEAITIEPKVRYGSAHLTRGDALVKLGKLDEAIEAYERYVRINTSSLEGYCKLAAAREQKQDPQGARRARAEALQTYRVLPAYQRRRQLRWWFRAKLGV